MIDFIANRRKAYLVSLFMILAGAVSLAWFGLNLGIDFTGGTVLQLNLGEDFSLEEVQKIMAPFEELDGAVVQIVQGRDLAGEPTDEGLVIKAPLIEEGRREELMDAFRERWPNIDPADLRIESVGAVIGGELARQALLSLIVAIAAMVVYITLRFEFKYAVATIAALLHDIFIVLGVFSILQLEVNVPFVAAILTVFGYSVNDTIVIIDSIRENIKHKRRSEYPAVVNESINRNLLRSLNTSVTTLLVLVALIFGFHYFIGSLDLIVFVVALIIGIVVGTYSSVYIASPLWLDLQRFKLKRVSRQSA
ncbi:MAG TPA: protein translocase subunit SecF [Candidatus Limnocylindrales bacterium]|nr:protein translocase subunit SecF [Candidatus Limnocylindrales bacterium]